MHACVRLRHTCCPGSGEDFSDESAAERSYLTIKDDLRRFVSDCGGNAVVVIDEAQKAARRALDGSVFSRVVA